MSSRSRRLRDGLLRRAGAVLAAAGLVAGLTAVPPASAVPASASGLASTAELRRAVRVEDILEHQRTLSAIARRHPLFGVPSRASGTPGHDASVRYLASELREAGYRVRVQQFRFPFTAADKPSLEVSPAPAGFTGETKVLKYSAGGDVSARITPVDPVVPIGTQPDNTSTSGCEASDFAGFPAGTIALVQRGTCPFGQKVANATAAGAVAVLVFNEGQPLRSAVFGGSLSSQQRVPAFAISYADGAALVSRSRAGAAMTARLAVRVRYDPDRRTYNVLAETREGDPDHVVMAGAHLDSVTEGPGINDNGSGSATLLEIALELAEARRDNGLAGDRAGLTNRVRFAWWGAEEAGLLGSKHYVQNLSAAERRAIALYLNFDMIASPNFVRFVYDGDNSRYGQAQGATVGPAGSGAIERHFTDYFDALGLATEETAFDGRSDYGPFIGVGIPAGGLFTGAEGIKTPEQARVYGGTAGVAYDRCYHLACDGIRNLSRRALDQMSDAVAHAVLTYARGLGDLSPRPGRALPPDARDADRR